MDQHPAPWRVLEDPAPAASNDGEAHVERPSLAVPRWVAVQMTRGPPAGHSFRRPVSFEMRVRSGPCHCGQSVAAWRTAVAKTIARASVKRLIMFLAFHFASALLVERRAVSSSVSYAASQGSEHP